MIRRFIAKAIIFHRYADDLNRRAEVENTLLSVSAGKRAMLSKDECKQLAYKLGVPSAFKAHDRNDLLAVLKKARLHIQSDRNTLFNSYVEHPSGQVTDPHGLEAIADCDELLGEIDAKLRRM
jgi:hypothetical protein